MYNYNSFIDDLFNFIKTELNLEKKVLNSSISKETNSSLNIKDKITSILEKDKLTKEERENNDINKIEEFLNNYFLKKHFSEIEFELNGHKHFSKKYCVEDILIKISNDIYYEIKGNLENKDKIIDIIKYDPKKRNHEYFNCGKCDSKVYYYFDFENLKIKTTDTIRNNICSIEEEIEYKIKLKVPSKKLVFTNYFNELLNENKYNSISINAYKGKVAHAKSYEADNIGYMYVGNTCPSVYLKEDKSEIKVGNLKKYKGYAEINSVCTDLWAVCFMDYDQFLTLLEKKGFTEENYKSYFFSVEVNSEEVEVLSNNILFKDGKNLFFSIKTI